MKQPAEWYDGVYASSEHYRQSYRQSLYLPIWKEILHRMQRRGASSVVDLGCGPGQFAALLRDNGIEHYQGFDFSTEALKVARASCPELTFTLADLVAQPWADLTTEYDTVIATEFLEHIDEDLAILEQIPSGKYVYLTVPNFMCDSHVRHFPSWEAVAGRYGALFSAYAITPLKRTEREAFVFYLLDGIKR
jgi:trans-aconitate methyltransferase